jgi:hypothetical protein
MGAVKRVMSGCSSSARLGHALAGAALLVLPAMVVYREGSAGVTLDLVLPVLFGIGYLIAAAVGAAISEDVGGPV